MRYLPLLSLSWLSLTACPFAEPCPEEGELEILAVDADGNPVCIDEITVTGPDGGELAADCDCGTCTVDTVETGPHEVSATVGENTETGSADLIVFERCSTPSETVELVFPI